MRKPFVKNTADGFTLIELSVILLILAIFAVGILSTQRTNTDRGKVESANEELERIQKAIASYVETNGFLPCPARRDLQTDNVNFGRGDVAGETCTPVAVQTLSGIKDVLPPGGVAGNDAVRIGMVPVQTLGLPAAYAFDPWNNRYTYVVIKRLAIDSAQYSAFVSTLTNGVIRVAKDASATPIAPTGARLINRYVIFSSGPDMLGAYSAAGNLVNACAAGTGLNVENCDEDAQFVDVPINDTATGAGYFDDFIRWLQ